MGTSEFMLAGLVPGIAGALDVALAQAGYLTSAFAAGMVAGAPLMAALARTWRPRTALVSFLALFVVVHVVGGLTTSFAVLFGTRVVAAVADAGFLAVALTVGRQGRAGAVLLHPGRWRGRPAGRTPGTPPASPRSPARRARQRGHLRRLRLPGAEQE